MKKMLFGYYPQMKINVKSQIDILDNKAGDLPKKDNLNGWIPFDYYVSNHREHYIFYKDVYDGGFKYRGIYIVHNRPNSSKNDYDISYNSRIYNENRTYWFVFQPIEWDVLEENDEFIKLQSHRVLDAQYYDYDDNHTDLICQQYRKKLGFEEGQFEFFETTLFQWLNNDFYNTAFTEKEKKFLRSSYIDYDEDICEWNDSCVGLLWSNSLRKYYKTLTNALAFPTDYSLIQGSVASVVSGHVHYWLQTCHWEINGERYANLMMSRNRIFGCPVCDANGVRPVIKLYNYHKAKKKNC